MLKRGFRGYKEVAVGFLGGVTGETVLEKNLALTAYIKYITIKNIKIVAVT